MEQFPNHELEYVVDDYLDVTDFEDQGVSSGSGRGSLDDDELDSDFEDDFGLSKPDTDTSAVEAKSGKDIQGIPWERLNFTREKYRETRLKLYKNYESLSRSRKDLDKMLIFHHRSAKMLRKATTSTIFSSTRGLSNQQ